MLRKITTAWQGMSRTEQAATVTISTITLGIGLARVTGKRRPAPVVAVEAGMVLATVMVARCESRRTPTSTH